MFEVRAEVSPNGKRIWVTANYQIKHLQESVPGASFSMVGRAHWSVPLALDSCYLLREKFKAELKVGPTLAAWARRELDLAATLRDLSSAASVGLERLHEVAPALARAVEGRPYQTVAVRFLDEGRNVLLGDTPGLGKTIEVLAGIQESQVPGPYLIVAPKTATRVVWEREIRRWLPGRRVVVIPEGKANRDELLNEVAKKAGPNTYVIIHPQMTRVDAIWKCKTKVTLDGYTSYCGSETKVKAFKELVCGHDPRKAPPLRLAAFPQLFEVEWGVIVADEADQCLLHTNKNGSQTRRGMITLKVRTDGMRIAVSGTPFRGRPHLLWGTLNWLRPDEFSAFWPWIEANYNVTAGFGGSKKIGTVKREDLLYRTLDRVMLRRTKEEVSPELPAKLYLDNRMPEERDSRPEGIWLPIEGPQARAYAEMKAEAIATVLNGDLDAIGVLAEMTRLQQLATAYGRMEDGKFHPALPSNKFDWIVQRLHEIGFPSDPQYKLVIVSRFTSVLELFAANLEKVAPHVMITGAVTGRRRDEAIDKFNSDRWRGICLLNTKAGGSAITLDAADEMIFLDRTHIPDDQEQAEERINNRRPEEKILQRRYAYLASEGTIDVDIAEVNIRREGISKTILDTRRGVTEWALKALGVEGRA